MVDPVVFLSVHAHIALRVVLTIIDLAMALAASFTLLHVLRQSKAYRAAEPPAKWLAEAAFLILVLYDLAWLTWYQRPETLATAALLASALLLLTLRPEERKSGVQAGVLAGLILVSVCQSFVRADVAFALNLGILLRCLVKREDWSVVPRAILACTAAVSVWTAATI